MGCGQISLVCFFDRTNRPVHKRNALDIVQLGFTRVYLTELSCPVVKMEKRGLDENIVRTGFMIINSCT